MTWVAGADGCPAGWLVVFRSMIGKAPRVRIFEKVKEILAAPEQPKILAIDIPIGLPKVSEPGGRLADREARKVLRLRKSSIFPAPSRAAVRATSFSEARDLEQKNSKPPKKLAKQAFYLFEKIREVDALMPMHSGVIFECHPEVCFWAMNQKREMPSSKKTLKGFEERCEVLSDNYERPFLSLRIGLPGQHSRDDFLDACAAAWTAERIFREKAIRFPLDKMPDDRRIEMAIWA